MLRERYSKGRIMKTVRRKLECVAIAATIVLCAVIFNGGRDACADQRTRETPSALSGKVVETMDVDRYTYVCLEKDGRKTWLAAPRMKIAVGQNVSFRPGIEMVNFESKTLNRKFDTIIFTQGPAAEVK
jgi:hypothetical protein